MVSSPVVRRALLPALAGLLWLAPRPAGAEVPAVGDTSVAAALDTEARTVAGQVDLRFTNVSSAAIDRVYLWLYPNRLAEPPEALDDVTFHWVYPRGPNPGSMRIVAAAAADRSLESTSWRAEPHAQAGRGVLWSIGLPEAIAPGGEVRLRVEYAARIPERYGAFGCTGEVCTLMGGFYPMLAGLDQGGWDLGAPPARTRIDVTIDLSSPASAVLFGRWSGDAALRIEGAGTAEYATLVVAPRWHPTRLAAPGEVEVLHLSPDAPPPADDARDQIIPYTQEDYGRFAVEDAAAALEMATALELPGPGRLTLVEVPLRFDVAEVHPDVVLVSDRYYRIWPARRLRKFHQRILVRAVLAAYLEAVLTERGATPARVALESDAAASYLTDLFVLREYAREEFVDDILQPVSFIPAVDQLLYAPQTMFAGAYFGGVVDDEPLRDHPRRFMNAGPRGRLYYEKLRDLLEPEALQGTMRRLLREEMPLERAAQAAYGGSLDWFFRQWNRPYPRHDYRLVETESHRLAEGGWEHAVTVERRTAPGDPGVVEPVRILVVDDGGERHQLVWDGRGERGTVRFRAAADIARVVVDPGARLVEQRLPGDNEHPRFDNVDRHKTRFVYNSFGVLLDFSSLANALLIADFSIARVHDVKNRLGVSLFRSAAVQAGLSLRYRRAFGPAVHQDKLLAGASARLAVQRLNAGFFARAGDVERPATELELGLSVGADDRLFAFEPREVRSLGAGAGVTVTRRDAVASADSEYLVAGTLSLGATRIVSPLASHTFVLDADAAVVVGDIEARSQLLGAGGPSRLRGFAAGELFGRARVLGHLEWRHTFVHDLAWNLGHYNSVRGLGGALYVDAGVLSPCDSYDLLDRDSTYVSAGYAFQAFYDSFGTLPQMLRVDVAVRLVDHERSCLGTAPGDFPPVMVYLGFLPPF